MKTDRYAAGVAVLGIVLGAALALASGLKTIDAPALQALQADGKPLVIVDVREPELFAKGHISGAINIPYDDAKPRLVAELKPSDRIVFVCHGGPMGDELGKLLAAKGYGDVSNLAGGMKKWRGPVTNLKSGTDLFSAAGPPPESYRDLTIGKRTGFDSRPGLYPRPLRE